MRGSSFANDVRGCGSIAGLSPPQNAAPILTGITGDGRCPRSAIRELRYLSWDLHPGAHGSNRTGRPFTGDGSGNFLYPVLYHTGFASQPNAVSRDDGMRLKDLQITSVVRCAPPDNKPSPEEIANCASYLDEEIAALKDLRVVVCLGKIAFDGFVQHLLRVRTDEQARAR